MADCASAYSELRDQVVYSADRHLSNENLKNFISTFQSVINSKRRSDYINNFNDLITVLENRGYIVEADVGPFRRIVGLLPNCDILNERIYNYECNRDRNRLRGQYVHHGKLISTQSCNDLKRISKQFHKYIRFQGFFPAFVQIMIVMYMFTPSSLLILKATRYTSRENPQKNHHYLNLRKNSKGKFFLQNRGNGFSKKGMDNGGLQNIWQA
jgi:hypothetical protein